MGKLKNIPALRFPEFDGEWENTKLGKVAKFSKGKGISKSDITEDGINECIRYGELYTRYGEVIQDVYSKTDFNINSAVISEANDVIIPASGETQIDIATASCVIKSGVILGGDLNIIKTNKNGVFLSYYLNNKRKLDIANLAQGISVVHLYSSQLALLNLNFPSLPEQTKIASFLTAVDEKLQSLKQKKTLLEQYKKGVMQKIFSQELRFKDENGNEYADWEEKKLGEVCEVRKGKQLNKEELTESGEYPCINGGINISGYTDKFNTLENTITISEGGNSCGFVNFFRVKFWSGGHNYSIEINNPEDINNDFLFQLLKFNEIQIMKLRVGSGLPNIQKKDLVAFLLFYPKLIEEQTKVATFLSAIDDKINHCQVQIEKTELWKKGLLQQMFC